MKGWRTLAFNILAAIFALLETSDLTNLVPDQYLPGVIIGISVINVVLRVITTTPVGKA